MRDVAHVVAAAAGEGGGEVERHLAAAGAALAIFCAAFANWGRETAVLDHTPVCHGGGDG